MRKKATTTTVVTTTRQKAKTALLDQILAEGATPLLNAIVETAEQKRKPIVEYKVSPMPETLAGCGCEASSMTPIRITRRDNDTLVATVHPYGSRELWCKRLRPDSIDSIHNRTHPPIKS